MGGFWKWREPSVSQIRFPEQTKYTTPSAVRSQPGQKPQYFLLLVHIMRENPACLPKEGWGVDSTKS